MKAASPKLSFTGDLFSGFKGNYKYKSIILDEELDVVERAIYGNVQKIDMKFHFDRLTLNPQAHLKEEKKKV